jgi:hypothetical protein
MKKATRLELSLLENAMDSLREGIEQFGDGTRPTNLKYAVQYVFHAVELFLKAALFNRNPRLIYVKEDEHPTEDTKTVGYAQLVERLKAEGIEFTTDEYDLIDAIRKERNRIEHHKVALDRKQTEEWIGRALRLLEGFVDEQFDLLLEESFEWRTYRVLLAAGYEYDEHVAKAKASLPGNTPDEYYFTEYLECPECLEQTIAYPDPEVNKDGEETVRCRSCDEQFYISFCHSCNCPIILTEPVTEENDPGRCQDCWDHIFSKDD